MRRTMFGVSGLTLGMLLATGAVAQTNEEPASVGDVVVTGSRLAGSALNSPVPVTAVSAEQIEATGHQNLADILTELPQTGVGLNGANSQRNANLAGLNLISLRHLGADRTLVLVNGRRVVAGQPFTAAVDINSIPAALVERVELVTGGASAVYGADAVSGVVNILLKRDFEGFAATVNAGITSRGDGESRGFNFTAGKNFDEGKGNVVVNFLYDDVAGVQATQRAWGVSGVNTISNPENTGPNDGIPNFIQAPNIRFNWSNQQGLVWVAGQYLSLTSDGKGIRPYDFGALGDRGGRSVGGDGGSFEQYDNLSMPLERYGLTSNFNYQITPKINFFFEGNYIKTKTQSFWQPVADDFVYASPWLTLDNPFMPADLRAVLTANGQTGTEVYRVYDQFGRRGSVADRTQQQFTGGIDGKLSGSWKYNLFAAYGENSQNTLLVNGRNQTRWLQQNDVILLNGAPACRSAEARAQGCVPYNPFGQTTGTDAAIAYSRIDEPYSASTRLKTVGASLSGDLLQLPAGPVASAIGFEWREASAETHPSALQQQGLTFYPQESPVSGSIRVKEAFAELRAPLIRDHVLINDLQIQAAGRVSDYNVNGTQYSWNLGGVYSPVEGLRFRVMRSQSVRAPNVSELFSPLQESFFFVSDPCDVTLRNQSATREANCTALGIPANFSAPTNGSTVHGQIGGNIHLEPETAKTWTIGATLATSRLPGLTVTVDYFDIEITDAIGAIPVQSLVDNCVDLNISPDANANCAAVTRSSTTHGITNVQATSLNIGKFTSRGVDFNLNYKFDLSRYASTLPGELTLNLAGTYLDRLRQLTDAADPLTEIRLEGTLGSPKWNAIASAVYRLDDLSVSWRARYHGSTSILSGISVSNPPPADQFDRPNTGTKVFNDLSVAYQINAKTDARITVQNIFDVKPPNRAFNIHQGIYNASFYDNLGTSIVGALTYRF